MKKVVAFLLLTFAIDTYGQVFFPAMTNGIYGFIDLKGNWVIPPKFQNALSFSAGFAPVKNTFWTYINERGDKLTAYQFWKAYNFEGDVARVIAVNDLKKGLFGLIDRTGNWVVKPMFAHIRKFGGNGLAMAKDTTTKNWGFINKRGVWVIQPKYAGLREFSDGLAMARITGRWGFIDEKGNWIIQPTYANVFPFHEERAIVESKDGWIIIDKNNNRIGEQVFDVIRSFSDGVAVAHVPERMGCGRP